MHPICIELVTQVIVTGAVELMRHPGIHDLAAVGNGAATAVFIFVDAFGVRILVERFGECIVQIKLQPSDSPAERCLQTVVIARARGSPRVHGRKLGVPGYSRIKNCMTGSHGMLASVAKKYTLNLVVEPPRPKGGDS
jgi:hypothetical protein